MGMLMAAGFRGDFCLKESNVSLTLLDHVTRIELIINCVRLLVLFR